MRAAFLLDVNVLIAMAWPAHADHQKVLAWLARNARAGWATCPITQSGFVRILSNPSFSPNAPTTQEALQLLQANLAHPLHSFWGDELSLPDALKIISARLSGPRQVTDAYLLGLAGHKGAKLATMDRTLAELSSEKISAREFIELI
ncbi:MAG TPA: TA system VapC family ribonuclease toxin [Candidatus Acidoferrum sp.]|nr:TA system VapC family ribonuclease toxin [Candidatus Acidoferrum sp.]